MCVPWLAVLANCGTYRAHQKQMGPRERTAYTSSLQLEPKESVIRGPSIALFHLQVVIPGGAEMLKLPTTDVVQLLILGKVIGQEGCFKTPDSGSECEHIQLYRLPC